MTPGEKSVAHLPFRLSESEPPVLGAFKPGGASLPGGGWAGLLPTRGAEPWEDRGLAKWALIRRSPPQHFRPTGGPKGRPRSRFSLKRRGPIRPEVRLRPSSHSLVFLMFAESFR